MWSKLFVLLLAVGISIAQRKLSVCSVKHVDECTQLDRGEVRCTEKKHKQDCLININNGILSFASVTAEEALVAAKFLPNVVVIGELRPDDSSVIRNSSEFEMAVVVKNDFNGGFENLKNKKFCSPGFNLDLASNYILKEFEDAVINKINLQTCSKEGGTTAEVHISNLHYFFGESCRPGYWVSDPDYDKILKDKYPGLNKLCPNEKHGNFEYSLKCLEEKEGDVAVTSLNSVYQWKNKDKYKFLCKDGSTSAIDRPCTNPSWIRQPWPLVVAHRDVAEQVIETLNSLMKDDIIVPGTPFTSKSAVSTNKLLRTVLFNTGNYKIYLNKTDKILREYIEEFRQIPLVDDICKRINWCTINDQEQEKCKWFAQASANSGIKPYINCVQKSDKLECLEQIELKTADVVNIEDYGFVAQRRHLSGLSYPETEEQYLAQYVVVVKNSRKDEFTSLHDLKGKKGCFSEYGSNAWLAFVNTLRNKNILPKNSCDYGKLLSDFLDDSCMPGARDDSHKATSGTNIDKVCRICASQKTSTAVNCNTDESNLYYGNEGALLCLKGIGDFGVIKLENYTKDNWQYRVLCRNGSLAINTGFDVDENCVLTTVTDSEVVTRRNDPRYNDLSFVFMEFEDKFRLYTPFELFNIFNDTLNLLFLDSTPGLDTANSTNPYVQNYINLFHHAEFCSVDSTNSAVLFTGSTFLSFAVSIILYQFYL